MAYDPREGKHFTPRRIDSPAHNATIDEYQGQALLAAVGQHPLYRGISRKCGRFLREVESLDRYAKAP